MKYFLPFDIFLMFYFNKKVYLHGQQNKKFKSRFQHFLGDIFNKYFKHNYNIMIETELHEKKKLYIICLGSNRLFDYTNIDSIFSCTDKVLHS